MLLLIGSTIAATVWSLSFKGDITEIISAENSASRRTNKNCFLWGNTGGWVGKTWDKAQKLNVAGNEIIPAGDYWTVGWVCLPIDMETETLYNIKEMRIEFRENKDSTTRYEIVAMNTTHTQGIMAVKLGKNNYHVYATKALIPTTVSDYTHEPPVYTHTTQWLPWTFDITIIA